MRISNPRTPIAAGLKIVNWTGSLLIVGGSLMVLLALDFGDVDYSWPSATVICLLAFGFIGPFIVNEWKIAKSPIIPIGLFASPTKAALYGVFACNSYVLIGQAYCLPLYSQSVLSATALNVRAVSSPLIISCSVAAAAAGIFMQQTGRYLPVMYAAQGPFVLGSGLLVTDIRPGPSALPVQDSMRILGSRLLRALDMVVLYSACCNDGQRVIVVTATGSKVDALEALFLWCLEVVCGIGLI
ncbi:uncharacterized protein BDV17DRAFT_288540 [Aspergillus undulatus]|uniref:uncharacterized protein n=1 Tax=Aspergillus undulatus TaxID=1810928 RepID=UPI003CCD3B4A